MAVLFSALSIPRPPSLFPSSPTPAASVTRSPINPTNSSHQLRPSNHSLSQPPFPRRSIESHWYYFRVDSCTVRTHPSLTWDPTFICEGRTLHPFLEQFTTWQHLTPQRGRRFSFSIKQLCCFTEGSPKSFVQGEEKISKSQIKIWTVSCSSGLGFSQELGWLTASNSVLSDGQGRVHQTGRHLSILGQSEITNTGRL